jgi:hypothetical protein
MNRADYVLLLIAALCLGIVGGTAVPLEGYSDVVGIIGVVIGVALGLYGDRWLRHRGDVYCQIERLDEREPNVGGIPFKASQSIQAHFFNDKDVDTGLTGLTVVFVFEGEQVTLGPKTRGYETSTSPPGVVNLPSRTWVSVRIKGDFYGPEVKPILTDLTAIEIKGKFPDRSLYHKKILVEEDAPPRLVAPSEPRHW